MKASATTDGRIWALAVAGAGAGVLATLLLFRAPSTTLLPTKAAPLPALAFKQLNGTGEEVDFYDPTPLFLPTKWNARPNVLPGDTVREPGDEYRYEADFGVGVNAAKLAFPTKGEVPAKPVDALGLWTRQEPFLGMGETDFKMEPLSRRDALVEVVTAGDGRQVFTQVLTDATPPAGGDWQPMEFLVQVEPAGLIGLPAPIFTANEARVVTYFQNYLAKVLRVGERLAPGSYRIKVGP